MLLKKSAMKSAIFFQMNEGFKVPYVKLLFKLIY